MSRLIQLFYRIFGSDRLEVIIEGDEKDGFVGHFKQYPDVYAQGLTKQETVSNLMETLLAYFAYQSDKKDPVKWVDQSQTRGQLPFQVV